MSSKFTLYKLLRNIVISLAMFLIIASTLSIIIDPPKNTFNQNYESCLKRANKFKQNTGYYDQHLTPSFCYEKATKNAKDRKEIFNGNIILGFVILGIFFIPRFIYKLIKT